jgi:hypothetical protein
MAPHTEPVSARKRKKGGTAFLLLLAFLVVCALLWFGYQNLKGPNDRFARMYRAASVTSASTTAAG